MKTIFNKLKKENWQFGSHNNNVSSPIILDHDLEDFNVPSMNLSSEKNRESCDNISFESCNLGDTLNKTKKNTNKKARNSGYKVKNNS